MEFPIILARQFPASWDNGENDLACVLASWSNPSEVKIGGLITNQNLANEKNSFHNATVLFLSVIRKKTFNYCPVFLVNVILSTCKWMEGAYADRYVTQDYVRPSIMVHYEGEGGSNSVKLALCNTWDYYIYIYILL